MPRGEQEELKKKRERHREREKTYLEKEKKKVGKWKPLWVSLRNRVKEKISKFLGENENTRDRY